MEHLVTFATVLKTKVHNLIVLDGLIAFVSGIHGLETNMNSLIAR